MKQNLEQERIKSILEGSTRSFRAFVDDYKNLVSHIVFRLVHIPEDREDLCQDVFVKIYQNLHTFQFESKVSTWIARIAYNTCINYLQKKKAALYSDIAPEDMTLDHLQGYSPTPETELENRDAHNKLEQEIKKLPIKYRSVLSLYHLQEMSYYEIGEIMNMPEGTVKNYLFRARKMLKEQLVAQYKTEDLYNE